MTLHELVTQARESGDYDALMEAVPYARLLGMRLRIESGRLLFCLPFARRNIGNVLLPALHGGVIGGFMEHAALCQLIAERESLSMPKTIDFSIDYLRSGRAVDTWAVCRVTKQGKRVAHVGVDAWQDHVDKPIAVARGHFLLT